MAIITVPPPQAPVVTPATGLITREWFLFFNQWANVVGLPSPTISLSEFEALELVGSANSTDGTPAGISQQETDPDISYILGRLNELRAYVLTLGEFLLPTNIARTDVGQTFSGLQTFTGEISPSSTNGIVGTVTNDNANAGSDGEYANSFVASGSAISLSNAVAANITSKLLSAGDWDVSGLVIIQGTSATTCTRSTASLSQSSATLVTAGSEGYGETPCTGVNLDNTNIGIPIPPTRVSLASSATVYLVVKFTFSAGSPTAFGNLRARRIR